MKLSDTCGAMCSGDFKERFQAEYYQLKIRRDSLSKMVTNYISGNLDFEPKCSVDILEKQMHFMEEYLDILRKRAEIEGISLL